MRNIQFLIFFGTVFTIFFLLSWYIYSRGVQAFPKGTNGRMWFSIVFIFLSLSYAAARFLERVWLSSITDVLTWIGSFWLAAFFYFLLIILAIDLIRLVNYLIPFLPDYTKTLAFKKQLFTGASILVGVVILVGYINSITPYIKKLDLKVNKQVEGIKELTIAFASDIHLGTVIGPRRTNQIVNKLNSLEADIILLGGDIVDEDLAPVIRYNLSNTFPEFILSRL